MFSSETDTITEISIVKYIQLTCVASFPAVFPYSNAAPHINSSLNFNNLYNWWPISYLLALLYYPMLMLKPRQHTNNLKNAPSIPGLSRFHKISLQTRSPCRALVS